MKADASRKLWYGGYDHFAYETKELTFWRPFFAEMAQELTFILATVIKREILEPGRLLLSYVYYKSDQVIKKQRKVLI